jgi:hypothetical protein
MPRTLLLALLPLCCLVGLTTQGCALHVPEGTPLISISRPVDTPTWAVKQRQLIDLHKDLALAFEKAYLLPNGYMNVEFVHGGGVQAPDDAFECTYKFPLMYALGGDDELLRVWWRMWQGSIQQFTELGMFKNEFIQYLDWHHNGEHYEGFWLAALCMADNAEYRRQALKFASFYDGTNPDVPNYDPEKKIIRSMLNGGAGPVLKATREQWDARGLEFWDDWLECGHDGPQNLNTTCFGTIAFMLTGDERHKSIALDYVNAWRERALKNGGIIPSIVNLDGTVPAEWWGGVMGWDFTPFGGLFQVSSGPRAAWGNAMLLTGDRSYYDTCRTLCDEIWKYHEEETKKGVTFYYVPRYYGTGAYRHGKEKEKHIELYGDKPRWYEPIKDAHYQGIYASILTNIYLATMREDDMRRVLERVHPGIYACGHAVYHEGGYERDWVAYLAGQNPQWPDKELDRCIAAARNDLTALNKAAELPRDKKHKNTSQAGMCGPLVNLMTGGIMPLWTGQLLLGRFFYFDPELKRPGITRDCAALVEAMTDDSATLVLVNTSKDTEHTVLVQTGAYREHQCLSVQPEGGEAVAVNGTLFAVRLAPGAGGRMVVTMKRYANTPTLRRPWDAPPPSQRQPDQPSHK